MNDSIESILEEVTLCSEVEELLDLDHLDDSDSLPWFLQVQAM
ncbi:MAG: hypothetical protein QM500_18160 [Methylococcales bacterium]